MGKPTGKRAAVKLSKQHAADCRPGERLSPRDAKRLSILAGLRKMRAPAVSCLKGGSCSVVFNPEARNVIQGVPNLMGFQTLLPDSVCVFLKKYQGQENNRLSRDLNFQMPLDFIHAGAHEA